MVTVGSTFAVRGMISTLLRSNYNPNPNPNLILTVTLHLS